MVLFMMLQYIFHHARYSTYLRVAIPTDANVGVRSLTGYLVI